MKKRSKITLVLLMALPIFIKADVATPKEVIINEIIGYAIFAAIILSITALVTIILINKKKKKKNKK